MNSCILSKTHFNEYACSLAIANEISLRQEYLTIHLIFNNTKSQTFLNGLVQNCF